MISYHKYIILNLFYTCDPSPNGLNLGSGQILLTVFIPSASPLPSLQLGLELSSSTECSIWGMRTPPEPQHWDSSYTKLALSKATKPLFTRDLHCHWFHGLFILQLKVGVGGKRYYDNSSWSCMEAKYLLKKFTYPYGRWTPFAAFKATLQIT